MEESVCDSKSNKEVIPQATAFTVHFDSQKQGSSLSSNKFIKRHIRNLSLPLTNIYQNDSSSTLSDGNKIKKAGNHSEGYFSSDAEEDTNKIQNKFDEEMESPSSLPSEKLLVSPNEPMHNFLSNCSENSSKSSRSETGTYTIDKENEDVIKARLSIDQTFGITTSKEIVDNKYAAETNSSSWINDWASNVVLHNQQKNSHQTSPLRKSFGGFSKIPSPDSKLRPPSSELKNQNLVKLDQKNSVLKSQKFSPKLNRVKVGSQLIEDFSDSSFETESFLRETEQIVSALQNRVSLSLDSEGDSDLDLTLQNNSPKHFPGKNSNKNDHSDSSCSESSSQKKAPTSDKAVDKTQATRYNRAFSLRKGRLEKAVEKPKLPHSPVVKPKLPHSPVVKPKPKSTVETVKPVAAMSPSPRPFSTPRTSNAFSRTDCGRFSMRTTKLSSPAPLTPKNVVNKTNNVKKKSYIPAANGRSNSTLSLKEVEFQNWKRRKSYDPMKAAAEGRLKRDAVKKQNINVMSQSVTSADTMPKSPGNPVLRSASFHGVQQYPNNILLSSEEDDEEMTLSVSGDDYEWPVLKAPKSSQEPTPQSSRLSLHSNISVQSLRHSSYVENGIDSDLIQVVLKLSNRLKGNSSTLLKKLRVLYDEDKVKCHQISSEIEQLECTSFPNSPSHSTPSLDLAKTFQNLKKISSFINVLDEVLFDEEEEFA